jgi:hypothetical protein
MLIANDFGPEWTAYSLDKSVASLLLLSFKPMLRACSGGIILEEN